MIRTSARPGLALAASLLAVPALAGPLPGPGPSLEAGAVLVHHKPGHQGGPPWTRGRNADRGTRAYDDVPRGYASRGYDARRCTTEIRRRYDPYTDTTVTRRVNVCD